MVDFHGEGHIFKCLQIAMSSALNKSSSNVVIIFEVL